MTAVARAASLALTLHVAVEGRHPFERESPVCTLMAFLDEPLAPSIRSGPCSPGPRHGRFGHRGPEPYATAAVRFRRRFCLPLPAPGNTLPYPLTAEESSVLTR